jgi:hypothetical protein
MGRTTQAEEPPRLAAIFFERDEDVDAPLAEFVAAARRAGARVAGFLQHRVEARGCDCHDVRLQDIVSGAQFSIMQDLGAGATGCRVDTAAIAAAAGLVARALAEAPDLLALNRFGKLECEGGGLLAELGEAVARGIPVVVCVPTRFREAWNQFAGGLDAQLPARRDALEAWWTALAPAEAAA